MFDWRPPKTDCRFEIYIEKYTKKYKSLYLGIP